jgi:hypothetical protein
MAKKFPGQFVGTSLTPTGATVAQISCAPEDTPLPGQPLLAVRTDGGQAYRHTLFPIRISPGRVLTDGPPMTTWRLGDSLDLFGSIGAGFTPLARSNKWLLISYGANALRLMPLMKAGVDSGAAISMIMDLPHPGIPPQVEVNPDPREAFTWADYIAIEISFDMLATLPDLLPLPAREVPPNQVQVLVTLPMPCGMGTCSACMMKTQSGWKYACIDGPVFSLQDLGW